MLTIVAATLALPLAAFLAFAEVADANPTVTPWPELVDPAARAYEDPFKGLDRETLGHLRTVVSVPARLNDEATPPVDKARLEKQLAEARRALAENGVDVDRLLSQRWVVAERRRDAVLNGNPDLDGKPVTLSGFFIPALRAVDGSSVGYLVAQPGMCSHLPAPPPNQLIRLMLPAFADEAGLYDQVEVQGTLSLQNTIRTVFVVDGDTRMRSAWTLHVDSLRPEPLTEAERSLWTYRLRESALKGN